MRRVTQISPMLAVSDPVAAVAFYRQAFGAEVRWAIGDPIEVAGLSVDGAEFFVAREAHENPRSPDTGGFTSVRIELFTDDPVATHARAIAGGAAPGSDVGSHEHALADGGVLHMLQGSVRDPFGHIWLIGKFLDES